MSLADTRCKSKVIFWKTYFLRILKKQGAAVLCELACGKSENVLKSSPGELVPPGSLVKGKVAKVLENGIMIKFLKSLYGFIYDDHLPLPLSKYKPKTEVQARVILLQKDTGLIFLSCKPHLLELAPLKPDLSVLGRVYNAYLGFKSLKGGHVLVKPEKDKEVFIAKNQLGSRSVLSMACRYSLREKPSELAVCKWVLVFLNKAMYCPSFL